MKKEGLLSAVIREEKKLYQDFGLPMAELRLGLPCFSGVGAKQLDRQNAIFKAWFYRLTGELAAKAAFVYRQSHDPRCRFLHQPFSVECTAKISYQSTDILSLGYRLRIYRGGKLLCLTHFGDTFARKNARRRPLDCFLSPGVSAKGHGLFAPFWLEKDGSVFLP